MLKTLFCAGVLSVGLALTGCEDGKHGDADLSGSGDNLKGRLADAQVADAQPLAVVDAAPRTDDPASACAALQCRANSACVVKEVQCVRAPCLPVASCEPIDPPASCAATLCKQGTTCVEGPSGAECVDPTCTAKCSAGQHCELHEVVCIQAPCLPQPQCVEDKPDLCLTVKCSATTHCETVQPQCFTTPCPAHAECVPN